jgi:transcriptional regulator with XRE-family HTH domain
MKKLSNCGDYNFGEMIKTQRLERGLSIRKVSDLTGISAAALSRWESGKRVPSIESFNKVMTALGAELLVIGN